MSWDILIMLPLALAGIIYAWIQRLELWRERAETFERIKRGRMAF